MWIYRMRYLFDAHVSIYIYLYVLFMTVGCLFYYHGEAFSSVIISRLLAMTDRINCNYLYIKAEAYSIPQIYLRLMRGILGSRVGFCNFFQYLASFWIEPLYGLWLFCLISQLKSGIDKNYSIHLCRYYSCYLIWSAIHTWL